MTRSPATSIVRIVCLALVASFPSRGLAFDLIKADEARRPDDPYVDDRARAGPMLGPVIRFQGASTKTSPFELTIELKPRGGAKINLDRLQVFYRKKPPVDLLPRIRAFIDASTRTVVIRIRDARVPVGKHQILVQVEDSFDHFAEKTFDIEVSTAE